MTSHGTAYPGPLPEGFGAIWFDSIDSTNEEAKRRAAAGAMDGTWYLAARQTAGRGRHGRTWVSEKGNLYASLLLRPDCGPDKAANLSFVAALAIADTIEELLPAHAAITLKWPNDVLVDGRKISGILLESSARGATGNGARIEYVIIGMGLNLASRPAEAAYPATALGECGAEHVSPGEVFEILAGKMADRLSSWRKQGFGAIRAAWLERAAFVGHRIRLSPQQGGHEGLMIGLGDDGALLLKTDDGTVREISAGDVFPADETDKTGEAD